MTEKSYVEEIKCRLDKINKRIEQAAASSGRKREDIILLAATKTVDAGRINDAVEAGIRYVAENRVQELKSKHDLISPLAHQHFIGHLQTNKVRDVAGRVELIHSVHSLNLAAELSKQAKIKNIEIPVLVQVNIGREESKSGFDPSETEESVAQIASMAGLKVMGLMTIPPICEEPEQNREYFRQMYKLFIDISALNIDNSNMLYLSMGMSDDYGIAIEEGANIVRLGTAIFGKRY